MINRKIEIFILTYNRLSYLKSALYSVFNQTEKNIKVTVMDNCSTDGTENYIKSMQKQYSNLHYYKQETKVSVLENFLSARQLATAEYVMIFHDDDILHSQYISTAIELLNKNDNIDLIYSQVNKFEDEKCLNDVNYQNIRYRIFKNQLDFACYTYFLLIKYNLIFPTCIFKLQNLKDIQISELIREADTIADKLIATETARNGRILYIETPLYNYRIHSAQESQSKKLSINEYLANTRYFKQILNKNIYTRCIFNVFSCKWFHNMYRYWGCYENYSEVDLVKYAYKSKAISLYTYLKFVPVIKLILSPINYILTKFLQFGHYQSFYLNLRKEQL